MTKDHYLLETAVQELRGKIAERRAALLIYSSGACYSGISAQEWVCRGMTDALTILEDMLYESIQSELETRLP